MKNPEQLKLILRTVTVIISITVLYFVANTTVPVIGYMIEKSSTKPELLVRSESNSGDQILEIRYITPAMDTVAPHTVSVFLAASETDTMELITKTKIANNGSPLSGNNYYILWSTSYALLILSGEQQEPDTIAIPLVKQELN